MLDEATSALDPNAEKIVQQALNNVAKGRTMIVIAHRLSTVRDADNIIVMAKGATVEQGSHSELIGFGGAYSRLVRLQDLGHGGVAPQDEAETDKEEPLAALETVLSRASAHGTHDISSDKLINHGLLKCLFIMVKEQRSMWWPNGAVLIAISVLGGRSLYSP